MDHTILYQLQAEIWFAGTQTPDPLLVHMHETQTAALVAADNSVILHFLKALWSYRIMQSLLWNKDAQPLGVTQIYFYPEKNRCSSCRLHMPHENYEAGSKKRQKITIFISVIHSITPLTTSSMSLTYWAGARTCSQTRTSAKVTGRCLPQVRDVAKPLFPLFLCFEIFLCPTFMSSSPSLRSTRDKD